MKFQALAEFLQKNVLNSHIEPKLAIECIDGSDEVKLNLNFFHM
jgi:hypothetical protein